ncbi:hypothetical protein HDU76_010543, partial [Blyttiomyces sp. JEL0837]
MKITVFGGSGEKTTGAEFIRQALEQGHSITALVRDPARLVTGDATTTEGVKSVLSPDTEAVVLSLGTRPGDSGAAASVCSTATKIIVDEMKSICPRSRLLTVTSLGVGDSYKSLGYITWFFVSTFIAGPIADKNIQEKHITDNTSWLDWIIVRPGGLTTGPLTGKYRLGTFGGGMVSRADVAHFLVNNLKGDEWKHKAPVQ